MVELLQNNWINIDENPLYQELEEIKNFTTEFKWLILSIMSDLWLSCIHNTSKTLN